MRARTAGYSYSTTHKPSASIHTVSEAMKYSTRAGSEVEVLAATGTVDHCHYGARHREASALTNDAYINDNH